MGQHPLDLFQYLLVIEEVLVEGAERIMMGTGQQLNDAWRPAPRPVGNSAESVA